LLARENYQTYTHNTEYRIIFSKHFFVNSEEITKILNKYDNAKRNYIVNSSGVLMNKNINKNVYFWIW